MDTSSAMDESGMDMDCSAVNESVTSEVDPEVSGMNSQALAEAIMFEKCAAILKDVNSNLKSASQNLNTLITTVENTSGLMDTWLQVWERVTVQLQAQNKVSQPPRYTEMAYPAAPPVQEDEELLEIVPQTNPEPLAARFQPSSSTLSAGLGARRYTDTRLQRPLNRRPSASRDTTDTAPRKRATSAIPRVGRLR